MEGGECKYVYRFPSDMLPFSYLSVMLKYLEFEFTFLVHEFRERENWRYLTTCKIRAGNERVKEFGGWIKYVCRIFKKQRKAAFEINNLFQENRRRCAYGVWKRLGFNITGSIECPSYSFLYSTARSQNGMEGSSRKQNKEQLKGFKNSQVFTNNSVFYQKIYFCARKEV